MSMTQQARGSREVIMGLSRGLVVAKALQLVAELGIADLLAAGPRDVADLALNAGCHERSLFRVLRALASQGVFQRAGSTRFENTPLSEVLVTGAPGSVKDQVIMATSPGTMRAFMGFRDVVRTGKPNFEARGATSPFELMRSKPGYADSYSRAMMAKSGPAVAALLSSHDFAASRSVVDVGGGNGHLLAALLHRNAHLRGLVLEQTPMAPCARQHLLSEGVTDRADVVEGDFFVAVPDGHDTYVLKSVLHDWNDEDAARILRSCRAAMAPGAELLIVEAVLVDDDEPNAAKWTDLHMMTLLGGLERSEDEWRTLLETAGFMVERTVPLSGSTSLIAARAR